MRFRFIGRYTNGHTSINACGVVFQGHEPSEVPYEAIHRLSRNIEFEAVEEKPEAIATGPVCDVPPPPPVVGPVAQPKRRGRPKKAAI